MAFFAVKVVVSALLIAIVSTVAKRSPGFGALIASLPVISVLGMMWLWVETGDARRVERHVGATFWYVLPSLPMFLLIPALMRGGVQFYAALGIGCVVTVVIYGAMVWIGGRLGVSL